MLNFNIIGQSTMLGQKSRVATKLKKVSPFVTSIHYIAYMTNLVASKVVKSIEWKSLLTKIDAMINSLGAYCKNSKNK